MLLQVPDVLTQEELRHCREVLETSQWVDGKVTAGDQAAKAKNNLQIRWKAMRHGCWERSFSRRLAEPHLQFCGFAAARPAPMFNRYDVGMTFVAHVDNSIRTIPGTGGMRMRADVSTTIFLTDPEDYDGGELVIEDTFGTHAVKLPAGHMVVYPSSSLHRVQPITRGSRWGCFFWTQSMIKDDGLRAMLYDLDVAIMQTRSNSEMITRSARSGEPLPQSAAPVGGTVTAENQKHWWRCSLGSRSCILIGRNMRVRWICYGPPRGLAMPERSTCLAEPMSAAGACRRIRHLPPPIIATLLNWEMHGPSSIWQISTSAVLVLSK